MNKLLTIAIFVLGANAIQAQQVDFAIEAIKPDSIFLIQKRTDQATAENPRPGNATTYSLFRSYEGLVAFIAEVRKQARAESDKAAEVLKNAKKLEEAADKIEAAVQAAATPKQQKKN